MYCEGVYGLYCGTPPPPPGPLPSPARQTGMGVAGRVLCCWPAATCVLGGAHRTLEAAPSTMRWRMRVNARRFPLPEFSKKDR